MSVNFQFTDNSICMPDEEHNSQAVSPYTVEVQVIENAINKQAIAVKILCSITSDMLYLVHKLNIRRYIC